MPSSPGRNDPCPCGSGKKYKKCCGATGAVRIAAPATSTRPPPQITPQAARELLAALDLMGKGRLADAELRCRAVLDGQPKNAEALNVLAQIKYHADDFNETIRLEQEAIRLDDAQGEYHFFLGAAHAALGAVSAAIDAFRAAIRRDPLHALAYSNLGVMLAKEKKYDEAMEVLMKAVRLDPNNAQPYANLCAVLREQGKLEEAKVIGTRATQLGPDNLDAWTNLGDVIQALQGYKAALPYYDRAAQCAGNSAHVAHTNRALALLGNGELEAGYQAYEARLLLAREHHRFPWPRWQGEPLEGKTILIYAEQGVGDEVLFANCFPDVIRVAGKVIIECDPRLASLFARSFPDAVVCGVDRYGGNDWARVHEPIDYQVAAGSLPRHFRKRIEDFPKEPGYLKPDPERVEHWKRRLAELGDGPKVGICWRSKVRTARRNASYTDIDEWGPVFAVPGVRFVNLQYDECAEELAHVRNMFGAEVVQFSHDEIDLHDDLDECAALYKALDIAISPGTAVSALMGAVGGEIWLIKGIGWVTLGSERMPWYPRARVFRPVSRGLEGTGVKVDVIGVSMAIMQQYFSMEKHEDTWVKAAHRWMRYEDGNVHIGREIVKRNALAAGTPTWRRFTLMDIESGRAPASYLAARAISLARANQVEIAKVAARRAYEMDASQMDLFAQLGTALALIVGKRCAGITDLIDIDYELGRLTPRMKLIASKYYVWQGRSVDAVRMVDEAYSDLPGEMDGYGRIAMAALEDGDVEKAIVWWGKDRDLGRAGERSLRRHEFMRRPEWSGKFSRVYIYKESNDASISSVEDALEKLHAISELEVMIEVFPSENDYVSNRFPKFVIVNEGGFIGECKVEIPEDWQIASYSRVMDTAENAL